MYSEILLEEMKNFGFSLYESKAFLTLLENQASTRYELSQLSGVPSSKIYSVVEKLISKGFVHEYSSEPNLYTAMDASDFLSKIKQESRSSFTRLEAEIYKLNHDDSANYFIWALNQYDAIISKANEILASTVGKCYISAWNDELTALDHSLSIAKKKGANITLLAYDNDEFKYGKLYHHTQMADKEKELILINDDICIIAAIPDTNNVHGLITNSKEIVTICREFILHEVYFAHSVNKIRELAGDELADEFFETLLAI